MASWAWFSSYLLGRSQVTEVDSNLSTKIKISCGVPQGSVLGPLSQTQRSFARFGAKLWNSTINFVNSPRILLKNMFKVYMLLSILEAEDD